MPEPRLQSPRTFRSSRWAPAVGSRASSTRPPTSASPIIWRTVPSPRPNSPDPGTNPRALHRFMRTLANFGILTQGANETFALTPLGEALKSDAPGAARSTILTMAGPWMWKAFGEFQHSLETGKTAMEKAFGMPLFDYLAQNPQEAAQFSEAMVGIHGAEPPAVAAAYDFSAVRLNRRRRRRHRQHAGPYSRPLPAAQRHPVRSSARRHRSAGPAARQGC